MEPKPEWESENRKKQDQRTPAKGSINGTTPYTL